MHKKWIFILGTIFVGTVGFWLFVLATYEIYWEVYPSWIYSKTIIVNPETGEEEFMWEGEEIHEDLVRIWKKHPENEFMRSVNKFGPLHIGGEAPIGIVLRPNKMPNDVQFHVFFYRMGFGMCNNTECAPLEGKVIQCMN